MGTALGYWVWGWEMGYSFIHSLIHSSICSFIHSVGNYCLEHSSRCGLLTGSCGPEWLVAGECLGRGGGRPAVSHTHWILVFKAGQGLSGTLGLLPGRLGVCDQNVGSTCP